MGFGHLNSPDKNKFRILLLFTLPKPIKMCFHKSQWFYKLNRLCQWLATMLIIHHEWSLFFLQVLSITRFTLFRHKARNVQSRVRFLLTNDITWIELVNPYVAQGDQALSYLWLNFVIRWFFPWLFPILFFLPFIIKLESLVYVYIVNQKSSWIIYECSLFTCTWFNGYQLRKWLAEWSSNPEWGFLCFYFTLITWKVMNPSLPHSSSNG